VVHMAEVKAFWRLAVTFAVPFALREHAMCKSSPPAARERSLPGCSRQRPRTFEKRLTRWPPIRQRRTTICEHSQVYRRLPHSGRELARLVHAGSRTRDHDVFEIAPRGGAYR
jgi:hypothetical protein